jgi:glycosyltransferase involved in cell wall biosynthesis/SAM-dependent methyltransferase
MRILMLQDEIYLPSLGGGTKANRLLLEALAAGGHACAAISPALTASREGPNYPEHFLEEMSARKISLRPDAPDLFRYTHHGVEIDANCSAESQRGREHVLRRIEQFQPDWIIVGDDKRRFMLESALEAAPDRVAMLLQTIVQLPFGPLAVQQNARQTDLMHQARAVLVISDFQKRYIGAHSDLEAKIVRLPVYGSGPFPVLGRFGSGFVTLINPCDLKGAPIFLELARSFPRVQFAAVPTWGTDDATLEKLGALPNVTILPPADDIEQILARSSVLLVPSLWPETFGYVAPEAMLRGIPVLASDIGGLPEAKLGVDYLLPVVPAVRSNGRYVAPPQNIAPWAQALEVLCTDEQAYDRVARQSREAAIRFVSTIGVQSFIDLLSNLSSEIEKARPIHPEFTAYIARQPYDVELDGLRLTIDRDVFPPDMGRCARNLARFATQYAPATALDMGCGSGYLALMMKQGGAREVWAADIHLPAVECARKNANQNPRATPINIVQSDLFENIPPSIKFDLIVFNQPFGPGDRQRVCGCGPDGGSAITRRFLLEAPAHLSNNGVLMMAFSDREAPEHDPKTIAQELGYPVRTLLHAYYNESNNFIYEIRPPAPK